MKSSTSAILDEMVDDLLTPRDEPSSMDDDQRVILHNVRWSTYVELCDSADSPNLQMTYLEGSLEIMTKGRRHEVTRTMISRFVELFCLERDIPLYGYGEMTVREKAKSRGLEPDAWYCRGHDRQLPEIALEVVVKSPLLDKLEVYRGLGIREIWVYKDGAFKVLALRAPSRRGGEARYEAIAASELIPEIDLARIAHYLALRDQHAALKTFRDELRGASQ